MKYVSDRYKIKKYREELEAAMNRFEVGPFALSHKHLLVTRRLEAFCTPPIV